MAELAARIADLDRDIEYVGQLMTDDFVSTEDLADLEDDLKALREERTIFQRCLNCLNTLQSRGM